VKAELDLNRFVGRNFFWPEGIVLVTTLSPDGMPNVAPKTQAAPVGRRNFWSFACTPSHHTHKYIEAGGEFVINIPGPELIKNISLAARRFALDEDEIRGSELTAMPSREVSPPSIAECRVHLECRLHRIVEGLGEDSLIIGRVVAASADSDIIDPSPDSLQRHPLLVYVYPDHWTMVKEAERFRFPAEYKE